MPAYREMSPFAPDAKPLNYWSSREFDDFDEFDVDEDYYAGKVLGSEAEFDPNAGLDPDGGVASEG